MNRLTLALTIIGSMAIVPATAFAMEPYLPKTAKSFTKADTDANGKITSAELAPRAEKRFESLDADHNGQVTAAEIDTALQKAMALRRDRILAALDGNKDGQVSRTELDSSVDRLVAAADVDHDGGVSLQEARKYRVAKVAKPATGETSN